MRKRVLILSFLAVASALFQGYHILKSFDASTGTVMLISRGVYTKIQGGRLEVERVREKDGHGGTMPGFQAGVKAGDVILAFYDARGQGGSFDGLFSLGALTREMKDGDPFSLRVLRPVPGGPGRELILTVPPDPEGFSLRRNVILGSIAAILLLSLFTAFFIGFSKPEDDNALVACLLLLSFTTLFNVVDLSLPPVLREFVFVFYISLNGWLVYLFFRFFLLFPSPSALDRRAPWLKGLFFWANGSFWILGLGVGLATGYSFEAADRLGPFQVPVNRVGIAMVLLMFFLGLLSLMLNAVQARCKDDRRRLAILFIGATVGIIPPLAYFVWVQVAGDEGSIGAIFIFISMFILFPLSFAYVVLKHRVFGIRLIVRRGLQWALVSRGFLLVEGVLIFALLFFGMGPVFAALAPQVGSGATAMATAILTAAVLFGLRQVNRKIMPGIDRRFFREAYDARQILTDLGRAVRSMAGDPLKLLGTVSENILNSLHPDRTAVFIRGEELAALPAGEGGFGRWSRAAAREMDGNFLCLVRAGTQENAVPVRFDAVDAPDLVLPKDALSAERLAKTTDGEPRPLEVYLDDPRSWASALAKSRAGDSHRVEGALLEALNARLLVPLVTKSRLLGFVLLGEKRSEEPYSREDKELLQTVSQQVAVALDYAQLIEGAAEQAVLKRDLEIATQVQQNLLPASGPPVPGLDYAGLCRPARGVGGDYFDFLQLEGGRLGLALGDISGKGVGAAILMASLQAMLRSQAPLRGDCVDELASAMNRLMSASTDGSKFSTFFYGVYDPATGDLTYVNAGHNPPFVLRAAGGGAERLAATGMLLGLFPEAAFKKATVSLGPGDLLAIYSDGVSEAFNEAGEEFGEERLLDLLNQNLGKDARPVCDSVVEAVSRFAGAALQSDDVTLVVAKVTQYGPGS